MYCILIFALLIHAHAQLIYNAGVSSGDIKLILDYHNGYRKRLANGQVPGQPRAINLKRMYWDYQLAAKAQTIAYRCKFEHVTVKDGRFWVGQNLGWQSAYSNSKPNWRLIIQMWFAEYKLYIFGPIVRDANFYKTGHYTQVAWANTYLIGCGYTLCRKNIYSQYERQYVCNYGPSGNLEGHFPYNWG